jgi:hypothetical protein
MLGCLALLALPLTARGNCVHLDGLGTGLRQLPWQRASGPNEPQNVLLDVEPKTSGLKAGATVPGKPSPRPEDGPCLRCGSESPGGLPVSINSFDPADALAAAGALVCVPSWQYGIGDDLQSYTFLPVCGIEHPPRSGM